MSIASGGCPVIWRVNAQGATLGAPMMGACPVPPVFASHNILRQAVFSHACREPVLTSFSHAHSLHIIKGNVSSLLSGVGENGTPVDGRPIPVNWWNVIIIHDQWKDMHTVAVD